MTIESADLELHRVQFQGHEWVWIHEGAHGTLTSEDRFVKGVSGYAATFLDGSVWRHGHRIGNVEEIEILGPGSLPEQSAEVSADIAINGLLPEQN